MAVIRRKYLAAYCEESYDPVEAWAVATVVIKANETGTSGGPWLKTILCYGDSNTWGYDPVTKDRFGPDVRWTGVLQSRLGSDYRVIEEGLNGRTTVWDDPLSPGRNGKEYLPPCLESHRPLDLVTIMLGTNDLKRRFGLTASDIAEGAGLLVDMAARFGRTAAGTSPVVLLIAPPPTARFGEFGEMFQGATETSRGFAEAYRRVAGWNHCPFLEAGEIVVSSDLDGIHWEAGEHHKFGETVAAEIPRLLAVPSPVADPR